VNIYTYTAVYNETNRATSRLGYFLTCFLTYFLLLSSCYCLGHRRREPVPDPYIEGTHVIFLYILIQRYIYILTQRYEMKQAKLLADLAIS